MPLGSEFFLSAGPVVVNSWILIAAKSAVAIYLLGNGRMVINLLNR